MFKAATTTLGFILLLAPVAAIAADSGVAKIVEEEGVRRQEASILLRKTLATAQDFQKKKDLPGAAKSYEDAYGLVQRIGSGIDAERSQTIAGLVDVRTQLATIAVKQANYKEADAQIVRVLRVDPENARAKDFKKQNDKELDKLRGMTPSDEVRALVPEMAESRIKTSILVQDGRLLFEMGKLEEANVKFTAATKADPENRAAFYYLSLIKETKYAQEARKREVTAKDMLVEVSKAWIPPTQRELLPSPNIYARTNRIYTGTGRQQIHYKLDRIVLNEVFFDGLPLSEVVKFLDEEARKRDPDKQGVNFVINSQIDSSSGAQGVPTVDPVTGQFTVQPQQQEPVDLNTVTIKINPPLRNLRIADVLDAVSKAADKPLKVSIEDYAVVFSQKTPEPLQLYTRTFRVDPNTFLQGLEAVVGIPFGDQIGGGGGGGAGGGGGGGGGGGAAGGGQGGSQNGYPGVQPATITGGQGGGGAAGGGGGGGGAAGGGAAGGGTVGSFQQTGSSGTIKYVTQKYPLAEIQVLVREFFLSAGIYFPPTLTVGGGGAGGGGGGAGGGGGGFGGAAGGGGFGGGGLGGGLGGPQADPGAGVKSLFFNDRTGILFVRATMQDLDIIDQAIQVLNTAPPQVTIEAKFAEISQKDNKAIGFDWLLGNTLAKGGAIGMQGGTAPSYTGSPSPANPSGIFPSTGGIPSVFPNAGTDGILSSGLRNQDATQAAIPAVGTITGILTDPQFRLVIRALEQREGVDLLSSPRLTTLSGRQAQVSVVDYRSIVSGLNQGGNVGGGGGLGGGGGGAAVGTQTYTTITIPAGTTLDVIPSVSADGYTIQMTLIPTITEFVGYDTSPFVSQIQVVGTVGAAPLQASQPLPRLRVRQVTTSAIVWDGQTVVLGGLMSENIKKTKDKVPVLGDIPLLGRLFRSESSSNEKKHLVIFVTPTIIDPAGNRVHSPDNLPYDPNSTPVLTGRVQ